MTVHLVDPHLSATGGCRCDCPACIGIRSPREPGGLYQRVCICPECSQDCGSIRGTGPTELGAIDPPRGHSRGRRHTCARYVDRASPLFHEPCGECWVEALVAGTPTQGASIVQLPSEPLTSAGAYDLPDNSPAQAVVRAWTGWTAQAPRDRRPDIHRAAMAQLRRDWPVLAGALDRLAGAPPGDQRVLLSATPGRCRACATDGDVCRYGFCIRCHAYDCERSSHVDGPHRTHFIADRRGH